jgi:hypothetical protein
MNLYLLYTHHKLKLEAHRLETCYLVNKLATILYSENLFYGVEEFNF